MTPTGASNPSSHVYAKGHKGRRRKQPAERSRRSSMCAGRASGSASAKHHTPDGARHGHLRFPAPLDVIATSLARPPSGGSPQRAVGNDPCRGWPLTSAAKHSNRWGSYLTNSALRVSGWSERHENQRLEARSSRIGADIPADDRPRRTVRRRWFSVLVQRHRGEPACRSEPTSPTPRLGASCEQSADLIDDQLADLKPFMTLLDGRAHPSSPPRSVTLFLWTLEIEFVRDLVAYRE